MLVIIVFFVIGCILGFVLPFTLGGEIKDPYDRPLRRNVPFELEIEERKRLSSCVESMMNEIRSSDVIKWNKNIGKNSLRESFSYIVMHNCCYKKQKPIDDWDKAYALCVEYHIIPDFLQWTFPINSENYNHKYDKFEKYRDKKWHFLDFLEDYYEFDWIELMNK